MNNKHFLAIIMMSLMIPFFIILLNLNLQVYNEEFALKEFEKNNVYSFVDKETAIANYRILLGYFKNENSLDSSIFNEKEKTHLADVSYLFKLSRYVLYAVIFIIALLVFYFIKKKELSDLKTSLIFGNVLFIIFIVFLLMLLLLDFSSVFESFHFTAFSNDLWQLNPETDRLIMMVPEEFFFDSVINIMINSVATMLIIFVIITALSFYIKHKSKMVLFDFKPEQPGMKQ